jgi:dihydrofolate reductase
VKIRIALIVAAAENGIIGRNGVMPWRMPSDLKHFRALTLGKPVIMGRKTFQSLGKPLDGRANLVVTRDPAFKADGIETYPDLTKAIDRARVIAAETGVVEIMVIGGGEIYRAALPLADRVYITRIEARPDGDASFPDLAPADWQETSRQQLTQGPKDDHSAEALVFDRRRPT